MKRILSGLISAIALQGILSAQAVDLRPAGLAERMTIHVNDGRLTEIFAGIQRVGGFTLAISEADKGLLPERVTLHIRYDRIEDIPTSLLGTAGLAYKIVDEKTVQVFKPATP